MDWNMISPKNGGIYIQKKKKSPAFILPGFFYKVMLSFTS
jgi:hypothetical protein